MTLSRYLQSVSVSDIIAHALLCALLAAGLYLMDVRSSFILSFCVGSWIASLLILVLRRVCRRPD